MVTVKNIDSVNDQTNQQDTLQTIVVTRNISPTVAHTYVFYCQVTSQDLGYRKSVNGGTTFGTFVIVEGTHNWKECCVWFSSWTNGSSGTIIHVLGVLLDGIMAEMTYFSLDAATDTAGTNNDISIHIFTDFSGSDAGSLSICEATNGEIFVGAVGAAGPAGLQIERSLDSGATFVDIGASLPAGVVDDVQDSILLMPLVTNDDVLMVIHDDSATQMESLEFFNSTDLWDTATTLIDTGTTNANAIAQVFTCTTDKTTGDVFLIYNNDAPTLSQADVMFSKFDEGTRTWSTPIFVIHEFQLPQITTIVNKAEKHGFSLCRDETDGTLYLTMEIGDSGNLADGMIIYIFTSSDEGLTWSDPVYVPTVVADFYNSTYTPLMIQAQTDGFFFVWADDGDNTLDCLNVPIAYETVSGLSLDEDTTTPVVGSDVYMLEQQKRTIATMPYGGTRPIDGHVLSAVTTGAHKILVIPPFADEATNPKYLGVSYNDNGGVNDEMDITNEVDEDP